MVWVNGHFSRQLSAISGATLRQPGLRVESLAETLGNDPELLMQHLSKYARYDDNAFTALSTAFFQDGAFLSFPDGFVLEHPVHLLFVSTKLSGPVAVHPRNLILVGKNSQVSILESHRSLTEGVCFTNAVTEILLINCRMSATTPSMWERRTSASSAAAVSPRTPFLSAERSCGTILSEFWKARAPSAR